MKKYSNLASYFGDNNPSIADMKEMILTTALDLLSDCAQDDRAPIAQRASLPLFYFNEVLDSVE